MSNTGFSVEDYKRKIKGLLDKAEATDVPAEQQTFSEAAERLMIKIGIARAEVEAAGGEVNTDNIVEKTRDWTTIYAPVMGAFASRVGHAYGDLTFMQYRNKSNFFRTYVIGFEADVDQYLELVESLHLQVWSALKAFRKDNREYRRQFTIHQNFVTDRSFVMGYAHTVANRLWDMRREEVANATPGAALVLASKMDKVIAWRDEQNPTLGKGRAGRSQQWSAHGAQAGRRAGQNANLGNKAVGNTRKAVR
jgi:hypothetical protein